MEEIVISTASQRRRPRPLPTTTYPAQAVEGVPTHSRSIRSSCGSRRCLNPQPRSASARRRPSFQPTAEDGCCQRRQHHLLPAAAVSTHGRGRCARMCAERHVESQRYNPRPRMSSAAALRDLGFCSRGDTRHPGGKASYATSSVVKERGDREHGSVLPSAGFRGQRINGPRVVVRSRCLPRVAIGLAEPS